MIIDDFVVEGTVLLKELLSYSSPPGLAAFGLHPLHEIPYCRHNLILRQNVELVEISLQNTNLVVLFANKIFSTSILEFFCCNCTRLMTLLK